MYSIFGMLCHRVHVDNENVHPFDGSTSKINTKRFFGLQKHGRFQFHMFLLKALKLKNSDPNF